MLLRWSEWVPKLLIDFTYIWCYFVLMTSDRGSSRPTLRRTREFPVETPRSYTDAAKLYAHSESGVHRLTDRLSKFFGLALGFNVVNDVVPVIGQIDDPLIPIEAGAFIVASTVIATQINQYRNKPNDEITPAEYNQFLTEKVSWGAAFNRYLHSGNVKIGGRAALKVGRVVRTFASGVMVSAGTTVVPGSPDDLLWYSLATFQAFKVAEYRNPFYENPTDNHSRYPFAPKNH